MCFHSRLSCIHNTLSLSKKICELYKDLATFHEIFEPCVSLLERYFSFFFPVWLGDLIFHLFPVYANLFLFFLILSYMLHVSELLENIFFKRFFQTTCRKLNFFLLKELRIFVTGFRCSEPLREKRRYWNLRNRQYFSKVDTLS